MPTLPGDFDWKQYLYLNQDLTQNCSYEEAIHHYLNYGCYENRKYKFDSDHDNHHNNYDNHHNNYDNHHNNYDNNGINILVVVVSCNKHWHLWEGIKNRTNNDLIIITGSNKNENWYDKDGRIYYLKCSDLYDGLPEKIIVMIEQVLHNPEFNHITHIIKIDDHDNYFNDETIKNLYSYHELKQYNYLGQKKNCWNNHTTGNYHFGKVPENSYWYDRVADISNVTYFDGGCSYILSRKAMEIINRNYNSSNINKLRKEEIYEDLMIGKILQNNNIEPYQINYGIIGDK